MVSLALAGSAQLGQACGLEWVEMYFTSGVPDCFRSHTSEIHVCTGHQASTYLLVGSLLYCLTLFVGWLV